MFSEETALLQLRAHIRSMDQEQIGEWATCIDHGKQDKKLAHMRSLCIDFPYTHLGIHKEQMCQKYLELDLDQILKLNYFHQ